MCFIMTPSDTALILRVSGNTVTFEKFLEMEWCWKRCIWTINVVGAWTILLSLVAFCNEPNIWQKYLLSQGPSPSSSSFPQTLLFFNYPYVESSFANHSCFSLRKPLFWQIFPTLFDQVYSNHHKDMVSLANRIGRQVKMFWKDQPQKQRFGTLGW